jgi:hypothetical protein
MHASTIALPLMKFAFGEIQRRERHYSVLLDKDPSANKVPIISKNSSRVLSSSSSSHLSVLSQQAPDLEELVRILQSSENHILATRILYSSWHSSAQKAQVL